MVTSVVSDRVILFMKILCWSMRGLGSRAKGKKDRKEICKGTLYVVLIQETKQENVDAL